MTKPKHPKPCPKPIDDEPMQTNEVGGTEEPPAPPRPREPED